MSYRTRELNEYRPTEVNGLVKLVIRNFCEVKIFSTQVPLLKKKIWTEYDGKVATLAGDEIVFIQDYLKKYPCKGSTDNRFLPTEAAKPVEKPECDEDKVYFEKAGNRYFVEYYQNGKKRRKYYSISKHGKLAKKKAGDFIHFKKTTIGEKKW
jgi:hypothetical protein